MEEWRPIRFTDGHYAVSSMGRVKNLETGRILKPLDDGSRGYKRVCLSNYHYKKRFKIHRLVAIEFIPNPNNLPQVNHIDGNKENNCVSNLEWVSVKENVIHAQNTGLRKGHDDFCKSKMIPVIGSNIDTGEEIEFKSIMDAKAYVKSNHVQEVLKGKRSKCKGFTFRYKEGGESYERIEN